LWRGCKVGGKMNIVYTKKFIFCAKQIF